SPLHNPLAGPQPRHGRAHQAFSYFHQTHGGGQTWGHPTVRETEAGRSSAERSHHDSRDFAGDSSRKNHATSSQGGPVRNHRRSEEHTSELQSRFDLVCRLLLEKK